VAFNGVVVTSSTKRKSLTVVEQSLPLATGQTMVSIGEHHALRSSGSTIGLPNDRSLVRSIAVSGQPLATTSTSTDHSQRTTATGHCLSVSSDKKQQATHGVGAKSKLLAVVRTKPSVSDKKEVSRWHLPSVQRHSDGESD